MKNMEKIIKKSGIVSIMESVIFSILGIILVFRPEDTVNAISFVLIMIFVLIGIFKIINYFLSRNKSDYHDNDLIYGIMAIVIGLIVFLYINVIGSIFRIIIGIWIIYTSLIRLNSSLKMKNIKKDSKTWIYSLVFSVLIFGCGLYVIVNSNVLIVTIGIIMIVYSFLDLIENIIFMINIKDTD